MQPLSNFGKDKSRKDGMTTRCKPCHRLHIKGFTNYVKKAHNPALVPPREISVMAGFYVPAHDTYYRNDGLKHIKSVGYLT